MSEKRFFILEDEEDDDFLSLPCIRDRTWKIQDIFGHYKYDDINEICDELNNLEDRNRELVKENEQLKQKTKQKEKVIKVYENYLDGLTDEVNIIREENHQLKRQVKRYKRLSEIRRKEIRNRIITIQDFIDNCEDTKVKKALEDLFHSEVKRR